MRAIVPVCVVILAAACSSSTPASGPCAQRKGTYVTDLKARSGDCGNVAETVSTVEKQPTGIDLPCKGTIGYSADNCSVTNDYSCPADDVSRGAVGKYTGKFDWSADAATGTGILEVSIVDVAGKSLCHGTYDVTVTRR